MEDNNEIKQDTFETDNVVSEAASNTSHQTETTNHYANSISDEYKPISMWGYLGYDILFILPFIGLICIIIFSVGGTKNKNLTNYARSRICSLVLVLAIWGIVFFIYGIQALLTKIPR